MKLFFARGVIRGMKYLHSRQPPVIHSDLKIQNVLVGDGLVVKVTIRVVANNDCLNGLSLNSIHVVLLYCL